VVTLPPMLNSFLKTLFWPWVKAWVILAWEEYFISDEYQKAIKFYPEDKVYQRFWLTAYHKFMKRAFKKHWMKIIFMPWVFTPSEMMVKYFYMIKETK